MMEPAPYFNEIAEGPETGAAYWTTSDDGLRLRVGYWKAVTGRRGTILIFPGRTEYIELQGHTARDLTSQGYSVFTVDWRGHGLSDRVISNQATLHVNRFADYQLDVKAVIKVMANLEMPKPWFLIGNSMGGCIGLRALIDGLPVAACAFTAPMWGLKMTAFQRAIALPVSSVAHAVGHGQKYVPGHNGKNYVLSNPFEGNRITGDRDQYDYWLRQARSKPCLQTAGSSMRWLQQSLLECSRLARERSPDVPCIAFCGGEDALVDLEPIRHRLSNWPNGKFLRIAGARHALLLEKPEIRKRLIEDIVDHFESWAAA